MYLKDVYEKKITKFVTLSTTQKRFKNSYVKLCRFFQHFALSALNNFYAL